MLESEAIEESKPFFMQVDEELIKYSKDMAFSHKK